MATLIVGLPAPRAFAIEPASVRAAAQASGLDSLARVPIPAVANLNDFLVPSLLARRYAIVLGKSLFWDMQAGSDGQACASCHFHAGADNRARNQLTPTGMTAGFTPEGGDPENPFFGDNLLGVPGFPQFRPDYTLKGTDFPFHVLADPEENNFFKRTVLRDTNDVASSMGAFAANFVEVVLGRSADVGDPFLDPTFNLDTPSVTQTTRNVRRVEPRHTPTVINAVFTHSNFWDGRAHNLFNGVSVIGPLDTSARIWVAGPDGGLIQQQVRIPNSSLASQAVGPPTSNLEMSFFDRSFPMVGRKLLGLTPLGLQRVHPQDSVLGSYSLAPQDRNGIGIPYDLLIRTAFQPKYWDSTRRTLDGFTLMEANFALFWGLAIQLYESTLVSQKTPFDRFMEGDNVALSPAQLQGMLVFLNRGARGNLPEVDSAIAAAGVPVGAGNCISCHGGPEFTDAAFTSLEGELIELEDTAKLAGGFLALDTSVQGLLDNGFSNIGVRLTDDDLGRGGMQGGFPLSFVRQARAGIDHLLPPGAELPAFPPGTRELVDGAFKIPGLRNAELTGPYFHNGGQATLSQVIEFYDRQSDFGGINVARLDRNMVFIELDEGDEDPLVLFLLSLTDERVRREQAPFDHPQLFVPDGGTFGNEQPRIEVPAVGAGGRLAAGLSPLGTFLDLSPVGH